MPTVSQIIVRRRARQNRRRIRQNRQRWLLGAVTLLLLLFGVLPVGAALGSAALIYTQATRSLVTPEESIARRASVGVTALYDRTGTTLLLADQSEETEHWLTLDELPSVALQATLLAEDPDFLDTTRFDLSATVIRLWSNLIYGPLSPDTSIAGRLVRNVIAPLPERPTVDDINRETALVSEIKRRYSPETILEWYLNTADYGNQAFGLEDAAQTYLGKSALELTLDETALLAAIPLAAQYNPFDNEIAARGRQRDLLRALRAAGSITNEQFEAAAATVTVIRLSDDQPQQIAPDFVAYARRQAQDILDAQGRDGAQLVASGSLTIITTLDLDLYYQTECVMRIQLARLNGRATSPDTLDGRPCQAAADLTANPGALTSGAPDSASIVIMDATSGEIKALFGPATRLDAQPGVALYPFVYFTGFISGSHAASMVLDIPRQFPGATEGLIYRPGNPDGKYRGPLNLRDAAAGWLLPPAVQIARVQGLDAVLRRAHLIGLNSLGEDGRYDLSLLERGGAVSVLDMTYAYSVFASTGDMHGIPGRAIAPGYRQRNPVAVLRIEDTDGNLIWEYRDLEATNVFPREVGYILNDVLADQSRRREILGNEAAIFDLPRRAAVVSGVTGDLLENWTIGYTPQMVIGVHLTRSDQTPLALDAYGMEGAGVIWRALLSYAHDRDRLPAADWVRPEGLIQLNVCERSGLLPNTGCPVRNEIFIPQAGFQPAQADSYWQQVEVNSQTGLLASATTPTELRVSSLYFVPPPEAEDWWRANNLPLPPTQYDTVSRPELFSSVQILQPQPYAYVGGLVDVRGTIDPTNMQYFQVAYGQGQNPTDLFSIGGQQTQFTRGSSLGQWDTTGLSGLYNLFLTVVYQNGEREQASVQVIVDNLLPNVTLRAGEPGQIYRWPAESQITLEATADDDYAIQRVEFYRDGEFLGEVTQAPYTFVWDITDAGRFTFSAVAFDAVGNQSNSSVTVEVVRS